jgi:protoporphyrinogen oxidase
LRRGVLMDVDGKIVDGKIVVIGAGPAGLTAAYELSKHGYVGTIVEADSVVGGIARTVERDGYRFDIGGHRFFTKVKEIEDLWDEMLDEPMLTRPRLSRIFYGGKFYDYPLKASNALKNMGVFTAAACVMSYWKQRARPIKEPANFEEWVTNQFGGRLFNMFFKSYTEKVWGCPCTEIGADWAAQRIKGLSLGSAIRNALLGNKKGEVVKTLIDEFKYPRHGPGQLWEQCAKTLRARGWDIRMKTKVTGLTAGEGGGIAAVTVRNADDTIEVIRAGQVFSSMPLKHLLLGMEPPPPPEVIEAAGKLAYRDFLTVALVLDAPQVFPDNWIYIHSPEVRVGRIQNFGNWSPHMVPDPSRESCLGLEYFVFEGDDLWTMRDEDLVELGYQELQTIGLARGNLKQGYVVRIPKAYPVYDPGYGERLDVIRKWLGNFGNLHCMGRNGQHRYNNQDHSMATALIAARNVALAQERDPWAVNEDAEYHEIGKTERQAPTTPARPQVAAPAGGPVVVTVPAAVPAAPAVTMDEEPAGAAA